MKNPTLEAALAYVRAGLSVIPVGIDGHKRPAFAMLPRVLNEETGKYDPTWKPFQERLATEDELKKWFGGRSPAGIAIAGGAVSGNLEQLDFDAFALEIFPAWSALVEEEVPGLVERLSVQRTPKPGFHVRYRCLEAVIPGNHDLAIDPHPRTKEEHTLIQTRGEGGYALAPGSPPACHETGRLYEHHSGPPLTALPCISIEEREVLLRCARFFTRALQPVPSGLKPGEDYDRRGPDWAEILEPHGWVCTGKNGNERRWRRPDKTGKTWSATTGRCKGEDGADLLRVFSSNAHPFEDGRAYGKFRALAILNYGGDLSACAGALAAKGYGAPVKSSGLNGRREPQSPHPSAEVAPLKWEQPIELSALPPPPAPPLDVLPAPLKAYVEEVAEATHVPADFVLTPMLAVASGAIGNSLRLVIKEGYAESACLWTAFVGAPGTGKTPALKHAIQPAVLYERHLFEQWQQETAAWRQSGSAPTDRPSLTRAIIGEITVERLMTLCRENPRGLLKIHDELGGFFTGMDQYKAAGKGNDRQIWLGLWSHASLPIDRKSNPDGLPITVRDPYVAIAGGIQPDVIEWIRGQAEDGKRPPDDGFLDRFLTAYPDKPRAVGEDWKEVSASTVGDWQDTVDMLYTLKMVPMRDENQTVSHERPYFVNLSLCGKAAWSTFTQRHADELNDPNFPDFLVSPWAKMSAYCARLALVLQMLHGVWKDSAAYPTAIQGDSIARAEKLIVYFKRHAERVRAALGTDPRVKSAGHVLKWLEAHPEVETFSRSDAYADLRRSFGCSEELTGPLNLLTHHHYVRALGEEGKAAAGRRPTPRYQVNPLWRQRIQTIQTIT